MALDVELAAVRDFLAAHPPFAELDESVLTGLVRRMSIEYHRRGTAMMTPGQDNYRLYVVRSGAIEVRDALGSLVDRAAEGECFGATTLLGGNPAQFSVMAIEDTLTISMDAAVFAELHSTEPEFATFFDAQRSRRLATAVAAQQTSASGGAVLKSTVRELITRDPVTVPRTASIRQAAQTMAEQGVSCLLVTQDDRLAGILTDRDLRNRVLAAGRDHDIPVMAVMTDSPVTAGADALAFEALLEMVGRNIHHLPLLEADGRPVGVVTTTDLLRLETAHPVFLAGEIAKQDDPAGVAHAAARLPAVVAALVAQDASAQDIGRVVTSVGDAVERRLIDLAHRQLGPEPVPYCWVTLGSRARMEQALGADQDNALLLADGATDADRAYFGQLAELVTGWLADAGYPRCAGGIMASNARWRMTQHEWQVTFGRWLGAPVPDAVLQASIFFDMRPIAGDASLYAALVAQIRAAAPDSPRFLAHLAGAASAHEPPLGFFRNLVVQKEGEHKDTLDIKAGGTLPVVELARVHALAIGSPAVSTQARLADAVAAGVMAADRGEELRDAFEFLSYARLAHQVGAVAAGSPPDNHIAPEGLSSVEKRHLREAFAIVRAALGTLGTAYGTGKLG